MKDKAELFENASVPRAVTALALPTVISQIITIIYNLADTFYVGQTNDPNQVAAVSVCMPFYIIITGIANLFGNGGASLMSRSFGKKNDEMAAKTSTFCLYAVILVAFLYSLNVYLFRKPILMTIGASGANIDYCSSYLFWVVVIGGIPTALNATLADLIRAEGNAKQAGIGLSIGGILNAVLDPIFILPFGLGLEITGAAITTMMANVVTTAYFFFYLYRKRKVSVISLNPRKLLLDGRMMIEVILIGLPGCLMNIMTSASNIAVNYFVSFYGEAALAGMGIAKKLNQTSMAIALGLSQGVLPLVGYTYASGNLVRMRKAIKFTTAYALSFSVVCVMLFQFFTEQIIAIFIKNEETVQYGSAFLKIICIAIPSTTIIILLITIFQAVGRKWQAMVLSMLRKGSLDIIFMILLSKVFPLYGVSWATPAADFIAVVIGIILYTAYVSARK